MITLQTLLGIELPIIQAPMAEGADAIIAQGLEAGGHHCFELQPPKAV
jgi:NAD(P)H-dependent flavin oxidoreductase YrpB (nitropropane dioxygenase family)